MAEKSEEDVFSTAVYHSLLNWHVLKLARENGFGGRNSQLKENWLFDSIIQIFKDNETVYPEELEDFLSEALFNEFDTIVEDGSLKAVCESLCTYYTLCKTSQLSKVEESIAEMKKSSDKVTVVKHSDPEEVDYDNDGIAEDVSKEFPVSDNRFTSSDEKSPEMEVDGNSDQVDEDGWQVVRRSKKR